MFPLEVNAALALVHILAAIGWMGTAMFLLNVLTPSMASLSPGSRKELVVTLFPRFIRYVTILATLTLVAGVLLAYGFFEQLDPAAPRGLRIWVGAVIALAAYVLAIGVGVRSARKLLKILRTPLDPQQGPPPEIAVLQRRMKLTATAVVTLLALTVVFMVTAARL